MSDRDLSAHGNNIFWQNPSWGISNSENSFGSENRKGKKPLVFSSNSPTPTPTPTSTPSTPLILGLNRVGKTDGDGGGEYRWIDECKGGGDSDHELHTWTERERRKKMRNLFYSLHSLLPQLPKKVSKPNSLLPQLPKKADKSTIIDEAASYIKTLEQKLEKLQKQKLEMIQGPTNRNYDPLMMTLPITPTFNTRDTFLADQLCIMKATTNMNYDASSVVTTPTSIPTPNTREAFLADQVSSRNSSMVTSKSHRRLSTLSFPVSFQTWSSPNFVLNVCGEDAHISVCAPKKHSLLTTILCVLEKHKMEVTSIQVSSDSYRSMFMIHAHTSTGSAQYPEPLPMEEKFKAAVTEMSFWLSS